MIIKKLTYTLCAFLVGIVLAGFIVSDDQWLKQNVEHRLTVIMRDMINEPCELKVQLIDLVGQKVVCRDIGAHDKAGSWSFQSEELIVRFSLLRLLFFQILNCSFDFSHVAIKSKYANRALAVEKPIMAILEAPTIIPFHLRTMSYSDALLTIDDDEHHTHATFSFYAKGTMHSKMFATQCTISNGDITHEHVPLRMREMQAKMTLDCDINTFACTLDGRGTCQLIAPDISKRCTLFGSYQDGQGLCTLYSDDRRMQVALDHIAKKDGIWGYDLTLEGQLADISALATRPLPCDGRMRMHGTSILGADSIKTNVSYDINDITCPIGTAPHLAGTLALNDFAYTFNGIIDVAQSAQISFKGSGDISKEHINVRCSNNTDLPIGSFIIPKELMQLHWDNHDWNNSKKQLGACMFNILDHKQRTHVGTCKIESLGTGYKIHGSIGSHKVDAHIKSDKALESLSVIDAKKRVCVNIKQKDDQVKGYVDLPLIKKLIKYFLNVPLSASGRLLIDAKQSDKTLAGSITMQKGHLKMPHVYNSINALDARFDLDFNTLSANLHDLAVTMQSGSAHSTLVRAEYDALKKQYTVHVPLVIKDCLINVKKHFVAQVTGALTLHYDGVAPRLNGQLVLDDAFLKGNLLSSEVQKSLITGSITSITSDRPDLILDVGITTKAPLTVKTPFFQTSAKIVVDVKGTINDPQLSGSIDLQQGSFSMFYKPMYITRGKLSLLAYDRNDISVDLVAQGKVKQFDITMTVSGTLKHPTISFNASPYLDQLQILTLLLTGSEQTTLSLIVPNVVMQNLEKLFFESDESSSQVQSYFKNILKPLKNIRIISGDIDDTKKGISGAIEVDITDRLRASLKNTSNQLDDAQLELEYALSDDMSIKAIKDEHGAYGGEFQMRWKF